MGLALAKPLTYLDYAAIPRREDEPRFELIDGRIVMMAGAGRRHQRVVVELTGQIREKLRGRRCELFIAPFDVRLPRPGQAANDANDVLQPDLMVFSNPENHDERGGLCAPEFVIEVLSPSGGAHDMVRKRRIYEAHGVLEYWIIDPINEVVHIHRLVDTRYVHESAEWEPSMTVAAVDGLSLDLAVLRDLLRDEA